MQDEFAWEQLSGSNIHKYLTEVATFRIKYFRDFPYFYDGNLDYEMNYLKGYTEDEKSILIIIRNSKNDIIAVSTGVPLITTSDILSKAETVFSQSGLNPKDFYYYGEVILDYSVRSKGLTRLIYNEQELHARKFGFSSITIATVIRDPTDPRNVDRVASSDLVWKKLGFTQTNIEFNYNWPTLQIDGKTVDCENKMIFWAKYLENKI